MCSVAVAWVVGLNNLTLLTTFDSPLHQKILFLDKIKIKFRIHVGRSFVILIKSFLQKEHHYLMKATSKAEVPPIHAHKNDSIIPNVQYDAVILPFDVTLFDVISGVFDVICRLLRCKVTTNMSGWITTAMQRSVAERTKSGRFVCLRRRAHVTITTITKAFPKMAAVVVMAVMVRNRATPPGPSQRHPTLKASSAKRKQQSSL